jgi:hypothetical protein
MVGFCDGPITVTARSKALTVFARSNAGIVGSNPTRGMDVCVRLFFVCVFLCVVSGLTTHTRSLTDYVQIRELRKGHAVA